MRLPYSYEFGYRFDNSHEAKKQLLAKIVNRVFGYDQQVIAIALYGDFGVILDENLSVPAEVLKDVKATLIKSGNITNNVSTQYGSDGIRTRDLCLDRAIC